MLNDQRVTAYLRSHAEGEDEPLRAARARSEESDIPAVSSEIGSVLRFMARATGARTVVEIGSGGGYSGLWFLGGMDPKGILTTIEIDSGNQSLAQQAFNEAGLTSRVRSLLGPALLMLPKLADSAYDIVFIDAMKSEYPEYLEHAKRLLRPGGVLLADNVLWSGKVADPLVDDEDTQGLRTFNETVKDDPDLASILLPIDDGLMAAVLRAS
ncbi:O-methyltransferase, family 3 [Euzebya pacifica]|uniref:O-methyltransferase, family 3 n=1 Tax=Euzebya pacifica TaxID=1608957 RepID=A0A346XUA8_9ACTN|nr:O-methyltransferase, family 3 [Euzebya pacifica]